MLCKEDVTWKGAKDEETTALMLLSTRLLRLLRFLPKWAKAKTPPVGISTFGVDLEPATVENCLPIEKGLAQRSRIREMPRRAEISAQLRRALHSVVLAIALSQPYLQAFKRAHSMVFRAFGTLSYRLNIPVQPVTSPSQGHKDRFGGGLPHLRTWANTWYETSRPPCLQPVEERLSSEQLRPHILELDPLPLAPEKHQGTLGEQISSKVPEAIGQHCWVTILAQAEMSFHNMQILQGMDNTQPSLHQHGQGWIGETFLHLLLRFGTRSVDPPSDLATLGTFGRGIVRIGYKFKYKIPAVCIWDPRKEKNIFPSWHTPTSSRNRVGADAVPVCPAVEVVSHPQAVRAAIGPEILSAEACVSSSINIRSNLQTALGGHCCWCREWNIDPLWPCIADPLNLFVHLASSGWAVSTVK
ncbi:hypothetical protein BDK51DRAFT_25826 [Blyttiomyces helicus]|uniref:Uncharacterized protein n=1 Tax=Blyttiomyces helicus TaxID=388810 RepID=A0A4P9WMF9_9FUNG|nr:hypothetical protein BDK51DRAFT_25826 [Blyttiomyces helicus]|eukprot:RKO94261.1 hypothetical protein BDK51DRAFT_25826 [Blyttiomyces helicus]